jgi:hypothetical protein
VVSHQVVLGCFVHLPGMHPLPELPVTPLGLLTPNDASHPIWTGRRGVPCVVVEKLKITEKWSTPEKENRTMKILNLQHIEGP